MLEIHNYHMTQKTYRMYIGSIAFALGVIISLSVSSGNWYLPGIAIVTGSLVIWGLKRRVQGVMNDERDAHIEGKAAKTATSAYILTSTIVGITLIALGTTNPVTYAIGSTMVYGSCALMALQVICFSFYGRRQAQD